jgi:hypothetical protein
MKMKELIKQQKLNFILKYCNENEITAYEIGKSTGLNTSGIDRILKGMTENPNKSTVNLIYDFLKNPEKFNPDIVEESTSDYGEVSTLQKTVIDLQKQMMELIKENWQLKQLLEKNNIAY